MDLDGHRGTMEMWEVLDIRTCVDKKRRRDSPAFWSQRPPNMACKFSTFLADRTQLVASYRESYRNFSLLGGGSGWSGKDMKHLRLAGLAISLLPWPWVSSSSLVGGGRSKGFGEHPALPCYREMGSSGSRLLCSFGQEDILAQKTQGGAPRTHLSLPS